MDQKRPRNDNIFEVQKIIGKRTKGNGIQYKVKWKGYSIEDSTWEPIENLINVKEMIKKYEKKVEKVEMQKKKNNSKKNRMKKVSPKKDLVISFKQNMIEKEESENDVIMSTIKDELKAHSGLKQDTLQSVGINPQIIFMINETKKDEETTTTTYFPAIKKPKTTERITELEPFGNDIIALVVEENDQKQNVNEKAINISELRLTNPGIVIDYFVADFMKRQPLEHF